MESSPKVPVGIEIDKVIDKFEKYDDFSITSLENLQGKLEELQNQLDEAIEKSPSAAETDSDGFSEPLLSSEQISNMMAVLAQAKEVGSSMSVKHRELHAVVSKVGKAIDKNFESSYEFMRPSVSFLREETRPKLHEVICNHLCREGMQDAAEQLMKESGLPLNSEFTSTFQEVNRIVAALRARDLQPAMEWAALHKEKLNQKKSSLEFKLHKLAFISMVASGSPNIATAVEYARVHLTPYISQHQAAIQHAMGSLVFMRTGLEGTPYSGLLHDSQWEDAINTFTRNASAIMGLSVNSPLAVCVSAGCSALPVLLNIKQALSASQVHSMWTGKEELPIQISLGEQAPYHSIFACPILRQQSTEANPPMRLTCGHVISKDALTKLSQSHKVKCPYCPVEQSPTEPKQIIF